ncbi:hypothetical protein ACR3IL_05340 [Streptococcus iniae]
MKKNDFFSKLEKARKKQEELDDLINEIFNIFDFDLSEIPFASTNATNLEEAISCYILYGEKPITGDISDFWKFAKGYEDFHNEY